MAESLRDIRRRIGSVKNTQKITKAMKMVAAAKLKRAENRARALAPYANEINATLQSLLARLDGFDNIPLTRNEAASGTVLLIVGGDRGLCGGFNNILFKRLDVWLRERGTDDLIVFTIGRKAGDFARKRGLDVRDRLVMLPEPPTAEQLRQIEDWLTDLFKTDDVADGYVAYNRYVSPLVQEPQIRQMLPFHTVQEGSDPVEAMPFLTDVPVEDLVNQLVEDAFRAAVTSMIFDSQAGEHGSRMTAMDGATKNAKEMIGSLTVRYNRARQASITNELMDIINGANSVS